MKKFIAVQPQYEEIVNINDLKKGDLFVFPGKSKMYVYNGYCRFNRAYGYTPYYGDISLEYYKKKFTKVNINLPYELD